MDKFLLDAFNKVALHPLLQNVKQKLDEAMDVVSPSDLVRQLQDAYTQVEDILNPANLVSRLDLSKLEPAIDAIRTQLQNPFVAFAVAQGLKELAKRGSAQSLQNALSSILPNIGPQEQFLASVLIAQLGSKLENLAKANTVDVAALLRKTVDNLSSANITEQLTAALQIVPQILPQLKPDLSQLPQPQDIAETTTEVIKAASDALGNAANGQTFKETLSALKQFADNANEIFTRLEGQIRKQTPSPEQNNKPKQPPRKKDGPGNFDI
jgi:hypothetical protein